VLAERPELLRLAQSACTKVIRRPFLMGSGLQFLPGWYEDTSFSHPLLMAAGSIDLLERVCYCYRQRPQGITRTISPRHFEVFDQYRRLFEIVERDTEYERFRPELFRLMINHYLVILGNERRLPHELKRAFFDRVVTEYRRYLPPGGYPVPRGSTGLKHRLVRHHTYRAYAGLRLAHDGLRWLRRTVVPRRGVPPPRPAPPAVADRAAAQHQVRLVRQRTATESFVDEPSRHSG